MAFQVALVLNNSPANAGEGRDLDLILGCVRSFGGGHGKPSKVFLPENDGKRSLAGQAVHRVRVGVHWEEDLYMGTHTLLLDF